MKINSISANLNNLKKINNPKQEADISQKQYAQVDDLRYMPYSKPFPVAFGNAVVEKIPQLILNKLSVNFHCPEVFAVKEVTLFNKLEKKMEEAFLLKMKYGHEPIENSLIIFDKEGRIISQIRELKYGDKKGYLRPSVFKTVQKDKYKGAGKLLIQACVEDSINNGCGGKLYARVKNDFESMSHFGSPIDFYQQMGFVFEDPNVTMSVLKQRYRTVMNSMSWETYLRDFVQEDMVLKPDAVESVWMKSIKENPIFEETKYRI